MSNRFFISGATGGLGKAFAVECARRGWDLCLTDLHQEKLKILADGLGRSFLIDVDFIAADLTDAKSRENLFREIQSKNLSFRGLINIAGLDYEGSFLEISRSQLCSILRLNIEATLDITHFLLSHATPLVPFQVITVGSLAAFYPMPIKATYAASKRFLLNFFLALREELRDRNVKVTILCPAGLPTTPETIKSIDSQGFLGQITTKDIGQVACRTLDKAIKGNAIFVPGFFNQMLMAAGNLVPSTQIASLIQRRWSSTRKKKIGIKKALESPG